MKTFTFLFCFFSFFVSADEITSYKVLDENVNYQNNSYHILRSFEKNKIAYYLVVNNKTLETKVIKKDVLENKKISNSFDKRYKNLLDKYSKTPFIVQNYGLKSIKSKNVYLTIDLCPSSKKGYEDKFINALIRKYEKNVPVTLFVSAKWIKQHKKEFFELFSFQNKGLLDITWGNHTYTHHYSKDKKIRENFLLTKGIDIEKELLENEKFLLSFGLTPSILFRAPGLVTNKKVIKIVKKLGLITVGSNTWLAKDENIHENSIILIHGNKNEPKGIKRAHETLLKSSFTLGSILQDLY